MARYANIVPLGQLTITAAGSTVKLSVNCGPQAGSTTTGLMGVTFRQIVLYNPNSSGTAFLLPVGKTLAANPELVFAAVGALQKVALPEGLMMAGGFLPENFCLDTDTPNLSIYGCGYTG